MHSPDIEEQLIEKVIHKTLLAMGIDVSGPEGVLNYQKDMHYLRNSRIQGEANKSNALRKLVDVIVPGVLAFIGLGVAHSLGVFRG